MAELEKVVSGLNSCFVNADCDGCPYDEDCKNVAQGRKSKDGWHCPILDDVLELLKKQVPKKVAMNFFPVCPECGRVMADGEGVRYCYHCGQAVKW